MSSLFTLSFLPFNVSPVRHTTDPLTFPIRRARNICARWVSARLTIRGASTPTRKSRARTERRRCGYARACRVLIYSSFPTPRPVRSPPRVERRSSRSSFSHLVTVSPRQGEGELPRGEIHGGGRPAVRRCDGRVQGADGEESRLGRRLTKHEMRK